MYVFVFQIIIIQERNFYIFTIFRDSHLVFVPRKKTTIFRVLCPELFYPYYQLTNYSWATILSWLSLPSHGINYYLMELKILNLLKHYLQLFFFFFFLLWCDDDTRPWSKNSEISCCLSLFPFNSILTWQDDRSKFFWLSESPTSCGHEHTGKSGLA